VLAAEDQRATSFESSWPKTANRTWLGPEYWANPLQDWRLQFRVWSDAGSLFQKALPKRGRKPFILGEGLSVDSRAKSKWSGNIVPENMLQRISLPGTRHLRPD
jgi:hypothetical protein